MTAMLAFCRRLAASQRFDAVMLVVIVLKRDRPGRRDL
jgi:hypothetical protein